MTIDDSACITIDLDSDKSPLAGGDSELPQSGEAGRDRDSAGRAHTVTGGDGPSDSPSTTAVHDSPSVAPSGRRVSAAANRTVDPSESARPVLPPIVRLPRPTVVTRPLDSEGVAVSSSHGQAGAASGSVVSTLPPVAAGRDGRVQSGAASESLLTAEQSSTAAALLALVSDVRAWQVQQDRTVATIVAELRELRQQVAVAVSSFSAQPYAI